jgi:AMP nucleosidase
LPTTTGRFAEQFRLLLPTTTSPWRWAPARSRSRCTSRFAEHDHLEGTLTPERRQLMRDLFDLPDLAAMDDGIANGTHQPARARRSRCRAVHRAARGLFAAPPAPLHGTAPEHFQNFVLFTNYQFYIDEFIAWATLKWPSPASEYIAFVEPGNVVTRRTGLPAGQGGRRRRAPPRLPQMPAYHLMRPTAAASPWSTSASARPTPRPSPTTSPCCARTPG